MINHSNDDIWTVTNERLQAGETFCLATVVSSGTPALAPGAKCIFTEKGFLTGTPALGADAALGQAAADALATDRRGMMNLADGTRVFVDILSSQPQLLICGAGHIAIPLARVARNLGFDVTVLDDRPDFAHGSRFPGCTVLAEDFTAALAGMALGPNHYVVVITRGHEHDADCLAEVLPKPTRYVGMIGSRRRVRFVLEVLEREGHPPERLREIFAPIGLPIGAESPEEIALTIAAELVCVRRKGADQAQQLRAGVPSAQGARP